LFEDYVDRETAAARRRVDVAETVIEQEKNNMRITAQAGLTTRKSKTVFKEIFNSIGDSLRDLACSTNGEDGEGGHNNEENTELGTMTKDEQPRWVVGAISKLGHYRMDTI
jgi:hypothetical protein